MNNEDIKELISILTEKDISEFAMERIDATIRIKRSTAQGYPGMPDATTQRLNSVKTPMLSSPPPHSDMPALPLKEDLHLLRSTTVGIFHDSKVPGGPPFVEPGKMVEEGQITGLIEILRLMSEIESDVSGEIVEKMVRDGEPVEYGQALFAIRPSKNVIHATGV